MNKLLRAGVYRCLKNWLFWLALAATLIAGIVFKLDCREGLPDNIYAMPLIYSVFVSLSIGREYSDGTVRNKIIAGHTKGMLFLSELILNVGTCIFMFLIFLSFCFSALRRIQVAGIPVMIVGFFLLNVSCAVIFTVISFLIPSRVVSPIVCIFLLIVMVVVTSSITIKLNQPEMLTTEHRNVDGLLIYEEVENPNYISGMKRDVYQTFGNTLPYGQINIYTSYMMDFLYSPNPQAVAEEYNARLSACPLYSLALIVILSGAGLLAFRKRNLW